MRPALNRSVERVVGYLPGLVLELLNAPVAAAIPTPKPAAPISETVTIAGVLHPTPPVAPPAAAALPATGAGVFVPPATQVPPISFTPVTLITWVAAPDGAAFGTRVPVI
jgi:hypothetical protein